VPFGSFTKKVVRVTRLKTVAIAIFFLTLGPASVYAQAPSQAPTEGRSPLSEIAHDVSNWFTRVIGTDGSRHREGSLPARSVTPLPRPRPTKLTSVPVAPNTSKPVAESVPLNNEPSELTTSSVPRIDAFVHRVFDFHGGPPLLEFQCARRNPTLALHPRLDYTRPSGPLPCGRFY